MARIRTIKPEFWRDEKLSSISAEAALLAVGLLNHCDDEGYFNAHPKLVESDVFPLRILANNTTVLLRELSGIGYIDVFSGSDGKTYGKIVNFAKHQVINKPTPSKIKAFCGIPYDYGSDPVVLPTGKERKGKEQGKGNGTGKTIAATALRPDFVDENVWNDYLLLRQGHKKPLTATALKGLIAQADKAGWTLQQALEMCCMKGWLGFNADWVKSQPQKFESTRDAERRKVIEQVMGVKNERIIDIN